jgi:hypothetical protein
VLRLIQRYFVVIPVALIAASACLFCVAYKTAHTQSLRLMLTSQGQEIQIYNNSQGIGVWIFFAVMAGIGGVILLAWHMFQRREDRRELDEALGINKIGRAGSGGHK